LKRILVLVLGGLVIVLSSCGGYSNSPQQNTPTSQLKKRAFLLNKQGGSIVIMDAAKDQLTAFSITAGFAPTLMIQAPGAHESFVLDPASSGVTIIDNTKEAIAFSVQVLNGATNIAVTPDAKSLFAVSDAQQSVHFVDLTSSAPGAPCTTTASVCIGIPGVQQIVMSKGGTTLLALAPSANTVTVIKTADRTKAAIADPTGIFDHPFSAVFSSDDSKAFVLSCGSECGGTQAKVTAVDLAAGTILSSVNVDGATVGFLDGSNLYIAGSPAGSSVGRFSVLTTAPLAVSSAFDITDGLHSLMVLANNQLYIGARNCTITATTNCLSFYNKSTQKASIDTAHCDPTSALFNCGDVTGMTPISGRNVMYVTEAGELRVYDRTTNALLPTQPDVVGNAIDVEEPQ
jgi:hypothetical protein